MQKLLRSLIVSLFTAVIPGAFAQVHLSQNFNGNSIPAGWTVEDGGSGNDCRWMIHSPNGTLPMLGSNYLYVDSDSAGSGTVADETITSHLISTGSASVVNLSFRHYYRDLTGPGDTAFVEIFNGNNWILLEAYTSTKGTPGAPVLAEFNITSNLNPSLRIRFRYVGDWAYYWAIDDVKVSSPASANIGLARVLNAQAACGIALPFSPSVRLYNGGSEAQTGFSMKYQVGNNPIVSETYQASLATGDSVNYTFSAAFNGTLSGNVPFRAWTELNGDADPTNDTAKATLFSPPPGFGTVNFSGFNGSNLSTIFQGWDEFTGISAQTTGSAWGVSNTQQTTAFGSETARVNLYASSKKEWIMSPVFAVPSAAALRFKVAVTNWNGIDPISMGSDDSVIVKVTTNCGQTWQNLQVYTIASNLGNTLSEKSVSLAAYEGQAVRIAFFATEGSSDDAPDYDVHLDDIQLGITSPTDLQLTALLFPGGDCGAPASFPVRVRLTNAGSIPQTSAPLFYQVAGQAVVSQTFSINLAAGATTELEFSSPVAISGGGNYSLSAWVSQPGDANPGNDSIKNRPFTRPSGSFATQTFTGFTGNNLANGWQEFTGAGPNLTAGSAWGVSNAAQTTALGSETAKVNLYLASKKEWIVTPAFIAPDAGALRFKLAVTDYNGTDQSPMGSDDSLIVRITTNCGQTWQNLQVYTAASNIGNTLSEKSVSLTAYSGQVVRVAFFATEGSVDDAPDYDVHLDDIQLGITSPTDLQLTALLFPGGDCGAPASFPVRVRLTNAGSIPQTSTPLFYQVAGQAIVSQTFPVSLAPGATTELEFSSPVAISSGGNYSLSAWVSQPGDANPGNDSIKNRPFTRPSGTFATQSFSGFNGTNLTNGWQEFTGAGPNLTAGSAWGVSNATQTTAFGSETARVNLYSTSKKEWIVAPAIAMNTGKLLRFKLAVTNWNGMNPISMGSDDSLIVRVSTNCGQSWQNLRTFTAADNLSNDLTEYTANLSFFVGQVVRVAFFATEGVVDDTEDYDVHLDDIELVNLSPADVGVSELLVPTAECGLPPSFPLQIKVANFGTETQSGITVGYSVNGGPAVIEALLGSLNPGQITQHTFAQDLNFTTTGIYIIRAWTNLAGDQDNQNDTLASAPVSPNTDSLLAVSFQAYNGNNLDSISPGWKERSGNLPSGTTSFWTASSGSQALAFGTRTARVQLSSVATRREWLISPGFTPSASTRVGFRIAATTPNVISSSNLGSDDSLVVLVSTNCGQSWNLLQAFTAQSGLNAVLRPEVLDLGAYAGQSCQLAFKATTGSVANSQACDVHLDSIRVGMVTSRLSEISSQQKLQLFPNPVYDGILHIVMPEKEYQFRIFSAMGKEMKQWESQRGEDISFDVSNLPSGLYFLKTKSGLTSRFVIP
jgi:hypothetical protein